MVEIKGKSKFDITKSMLDLEQQDIEIFFLFEIVLRFLLYIDTTDENQGLVSYIWKFCIILNQGWRPTNVHPLLELRVNTDMHAMAFLAG